MRPPKPIPEERLAELAEFGRRRSKGKELLRFLCVWMRVERGMRVGEIAAALGLCERTVRAAQAAFIRGGAGALREGAYGGRRRQLMTAGEETEFIGGFLGAAGDASVLVAGEIKAALEGRLGREVHETTVYRMLKRHGWRKVAPRPRHPRQDKEAAGAFKKGATRMR
jgi:transposase